jgi:hypothetical protein
MAHPLVGEVGKKAAVAWLGGPMVQNPRMAWCAWFDDALYVVSGPGEQDLGELADGVEVTLRGDHGGRVVTWPATVTRVVPGGEEWEKIAPQLAGKRLNAEGSTDQVVVRWASHNVVYALRPGSDATTGTDLPAGSLAEPPRPTPAASATKRPFRLHRVRKR